MASTTAPVPRCERQEKGLRKKFPRYKSRNPLKNIDSDEEIQDNPTFVSGGLRSETTRSQENPKELIGPMSRPYDTKSQCIISSLVCPKNLRVAEKRA
jgi:hypothetical protein